MPVTLPLFGFMVCVLSLSAATGISELISNVDIAFPFYCRSLFPVAAFVGIVMLLLDWRFSNSKGKLISGLALCLLVACGFLGWICAQSIIGF